MDHVEKFLTVFDVARLIDKSPGRVRQLADSGQLSCVRTPRGMRLIDEKSVQKFLQKRSQAAAREAASAT